MADLIMIEKWAENLDEATVSRWLVEVGDAVESGDGLCEIITDKATFEYEVERAGVVRAIYAPPRSTVPVGYVIAFIGAPGEQPPADIEERNRLLMEAHRQAAEAELELEIDLLARGSRRERRAPAPRPREARGTPAARHLARDRDVTLEEVATALRKSGVITEEDVRRFLGEE